jgi:hypothetical protein
MILGYPFLQEFNPSIDWKEGKLIQGAVQLQSTRFKHVKSFLQRAHKTFTKTRVLPAKVGTFLRRSTLAQDWERWEQKRRTLPSLEKIPKGFHKYWRAFSEELSKQLPPPRNPDMTITMVPDAPKSRKCRPYARSQKEAKIEDLWVKEQLDLG